MMVDDVNQITKTRKLAVKLLRRNSTRGRDGERSERQTPNLLKQDLVIAGRKHSQPRRNRKLHLSVFSSTGPAPKSISPSRLSEGDRLRMEMKEMGGTTTEKLLAGSLPPDSITHSRTTRHSSVAG